MRHAKLGVAAVFSLAMSVVPMRAQQMSGYGERPEIPPPKESWLPT